jgi:hypothetical protein
MVLRGFVMMLSSLGVVLCDLGFACGHCFFLLIPPKRKAGCDYGIDMRKIRERRSPW